MRVSKKTLIHTIRKCDGIPSQIAKSIGISAHAVRKRLREDKSLAAVANEAKESLVDLAQSKLRGLIEDADFRAVKFVLETWGRNRGFGKEIKIESEERPHVVLYLPDNGRHRKPEAGNSSELPN